MDIPQDFKPLFRSSPFLDLLGPFYYRENSEGFTVGIRVEEKHTNARGLAHGGLFMALADIALGYSAAFSKDPPLKLVTTTMTTDFAGSAKIGDWLEAAVDIQKTGSRLVFANTYIRAGEERVVRASASFLVLS
ncbi:PaaI family thioesterase [Pseudomonas viciae]|uniref:PaaI family thioesterase n=1 Tax=Pseudomonas viciae TaxID=2505979 RepID=A0A4P7PKG7_9PSED|nr:PaaI family thioesterase [Pseudomonas viciae]QBZ90922.1 PaaI family thioesterase [Pseudomonas viciae]WGO91814.1 PaaI family thioesterase [Pseudomonas viciae]